MNHHDPAIHPFSAGPDLDFEIRTVLGQASEGASEIGEVLAATAGIRKDDHDGWYRAWFDLGQRVESIAVDAASRDHSVSAAEAFLRASSYFSVATNAISALADISLLLPTFRRQQAAWDSFVAHTPVDVTPVEIPYEGSSLPGYFFRPGSSRETHRTLVAVNGSDGSLASLWATCISPGLKRGYNVLVFDGPGQQSELFERGTSFRPDWEKVLTPVYDFVSRLAGVDDRRIAVYGISQGGYWVARAVAFEHRYCAAVTDPGVVDISASWTKHIPRDLLRALDQGKVQKFDKDLAFEFTLSPETARTWRFRARPYGMHGYAETLAAVREYTLADVAALIRTPLLILAAEGEQFWPGQSKILADVTRPASTLTHFTAGEGADQHCQPLARQVTAQRIFDWLDERLADERP